MSKSDDSEIRRRLECISRIEPTSEATDKAMESVRRTLAKEEQSHESGKPPIWRLIWGRHLPRLAAAALLLITAGYLVGRFSAPRPPDMEQLQAALESRLRSSLEPVIRQGLLTDLSDSWQSALAAYHTRLNDHFNELAVGLDIKHRRELNEYAIRTLGASNAVAHQLLKDLVQTIAAAQKQDRRWVASALNQIESNRREDTTKFEKGLVNLASMTATELRRTKYDMARFLSFSESDGMDSSPPELPKPQIERDRR